MKSMIVAVVLGAGIAVQAAGPTFQTGWADLAQAARAALSVRQVTLDQENSDFVFYVSDVEFGSEEHPCFRGVILDKKTAAVVDPKSHTGIDLNFSYSDLFFIENSLVEICAD